MNDLYSILSVSADDIVIDIRYCIIYVLREGMLDLSEAWVHRPILERFSGYTHQNAIRLHRIAVAPDDCLVFALQLVDPDVAIQEIVDDISDLLREVLPWPHALEVEHPWREGTDFHYRYSRVCGGRADGIYRGCPSLQAGQ